MGNKIGVDREVGTGTHRIFLCLLEQEITGDVLLDLNMDTLKEMGIAAYGRRYKIMTAISNLVAHQAGQAPLTSCKRMANMDAMVKVSRE